MPPPARQHSALPAADLRPTPMAALTTHVHPPLLMDGKTPVSQSIGLRLIGSRLPVSHTH